MGTNSVVLPNGFVEDNPSAGLPEGFVEDQQSQPSIMDDYGKQPSALQATMREQSWPVRNLAGIGSAPAKLYYGAKQLVKGGTLSPEDQQAVKDWSTIEQEAPVGAIAGNIGQMYLAGRGMGAIPALAPAGQALLAPKTYLQAAGAGAAYAGIQPTESQGTEGLLRRGGQAALGGFLSAGMMKLVNSAGGYLANKFGQRGTLVPDDIDEAIGATLRQTGQTIDDLPPAYADELRKQVSASLQQNQKLDIPSALRAQEFKGAGIEPTLGQVTRDPMQYATERNLRGVAGVGEPLLNRFSGQETALRGKISDFAKGAADRYQAGSKIGDALEQADTALSRNVSKLYQEARKSAGKDLELPLQGLAQDYATILKDFGDKIPSGVRNNLDDLGLLTGKQNKMFTVEEADRLLKVINSNQSNDPAVNAALSALRNSVKGAVTEVDATGGVFAPAVKAAAQRFKMHDMLPALQQASKGEIDADKFVAKHIVGAKPEAVNVLAKMLKSTNEDAFNQAKAQVGEHLRRAAYGINEAGDAGFRPAGFSKALDSMGERLKAFYTPDEIKQLKQLSRVGSYMSAFPAQAAVSTSSSGVPVQNALMGILGSKVPFLSTGINMVKSAVKTGQQRAGVSNAIAANIPSRLLELAPGELQKYQGRLSALAMPMAYTIPMNIEAMK